MVLYLWIQPNKNSANHVVLQYIFIEKKKNLWNCAVQTYVVQGQLYYAFSYIYIYTYDSLISKLGTIRD